MLYQAYTELFDVNYGCLTIFRVIKLTSLTVVLPTREKSIYIGFLRSYQSYWYNNCRRSTNPVIKHQVISHWMIWQPICGTLRLEIAKEIEIAYHLQERVHKKILPVTGDLPSHTTGQWCGNRLHVIGRRMRLSYDVDGYYGHYIIIFVPCSTDNWITIVTTSHRDSPSELCGVNNMPPPLDDIWFGSDISIRTARLYIVHIYMSIWRGM